VAVVGALAAVPQVRDLAVSTINGVTAGPAPVTHGTSADQVAGDAVGNAESVKASTYLPRHALPPHAVSHAVTSARAQPTHARRQGRRASTGESGVPVHRPARHHLSTRPPQPGSTSPRPVNSSAPGAVSTPGTVGTSGSHSVPRCTGTADMLPENYATIVDFL